SVPAGSVVILHYDLVHRGTRQGPGTPAARYMYKFSFLRTREPGPSQPQRHRIHPAEPKTDAADSATDPAAYPAAWALRWLRGEPEPCIPSAAQVDIWLNGLRSPEEPVRRAAGFALGAAGHTPSSGDHPISDHALQGLAQATTDSDVRVRRMAAFALGETRRIEPAAVAALTSALGDPDDLVRSNAATALGSLLRVGALPESVTDALLERLDPALEPGNTQSAGMSRSTVRECVAEALLMAARNGRLTDLQRQLLAMRGRNDSGRYVRGLIEHALLRDGYAENTQTQRDEAAQ
ncbi:MAG: HEAT repeat domain-containing protein, partial [Gammaproteobacteria bacterium]